MVAWNPYPDANSYNLCKAFRGRVLNRENISSSIHTAVIRSEDLFNSSSEELYIYFVEAVTDNNIDASSYALQINPNGIYT